MKNILLCLVLACGKLFAQPVIQNVSPLSAKASEPVVIKGRNFNLIAANNIVYFGAVKAIVLKATADTIFTQVPLGASYNFITVTTNGLTAYSPQKFLLAAGGGNTISTSTFSMGQSFSMSHDPVALAVADFNGDGYADIAAANYGDTALDILKNTSTINLSLAAKIAYHTGARPGDVQAGDIDGDGKPDIVTANDESQSLSVFINTSTGGDISFKPAQNIATGTYAVGVALGDMDGDGKVDLVELNNIQSTVSIFLNTGTPGNLSFAPAINLSTGFSPNKVAIADMSMDGLPDIVVTNLLANTISVLINTSYSGSTQFNPRVDFATGFNPHNLAIGDFNKDNRPDIATGNGDSTISVFTNTFNGMEPTFTTQNIVIGQSPHEIAIDDIDGDGKLDITAAGSETFIAVLKNTTAGNSISFAPQVAYTTQSSASSIALADLNNDGRPDMLAGGSNSLLLFTNRIPANTNNCPGQNTIVYSNIESFLYQWQVDKGAGFINITDDGTYTGATYSRLLQIKNIPSAWYGYKYRCITASGTSDVYTIKFQNNWLGGNSTNWEAPANWGCRSLPDENTDVLITTGTIFINSNVTVHGLQLNPGVQLTVGTGFTLTIKQ